MPKAKASITQDEYLDFVINNAEDIQGVLELWGDVSKRLPEWIDGRVKRAIGDLRHTYFTELDLNCVVGEDDIFWYNKESFDFAADRGVYFTYEFGEFTLDGLAKRDPEEVGCLCLAYADGDRSKPKAKQELEDWAARFYGQRTAMGSKGILVNPYKGEDEEYILVLKLHDAVNLDVLRQGGTTELDRLVQAKARALTDAALPILRKE